MPSGVFTISDYASDSADYFGDYCDMCPASSDGAWQNIGRTVTGSDDGYPIVWFDGYLYLGSCDAPSGARLYRYDGGTTWTDVSGALGSSGAVVNLLEFDSKLYIATGWDANGHVYCYDGESTTDCGIPSAYAWGLAAHDGYLYAGDNADGTVHRYDGGTSWTSLGTTNVEIWRMVSFAGELFVGGRQTDSDVGNIRHWDGGTSWSKAGFISDGNFVQAFASLEGSLYAGGKNGYIYKYAGWPGTTWSGFDTGEDSIGEMIAYDGKIAVGTAAQGKVGLYDGASSWESLGWLGTNSWIDGLGTDGTSLYAVGYDNGYVYKYPYTSSGAYLIVGAYNANEPTYGRTGAAYLLHYSADAWHHERKLVSTNPGVDSPNRYGSCSRVDGDWILITSYYSNTQRGKAFLYKISDAGFEQVIAHPSPVNYDCFGWDADVSGTWLAIGVPNDDDTYSGSGSVLLFHNDGGATPWVYKQTIHSPTPDGGACFGESVAMNGSVCVIGEPYNDNFSGGCLHVFEESGGTWTFKKTMSRSSTHSYNYFGEINSLSLGRGPLLAVGTDWISAGCPFEYNGGYNYSGAAYLFQKSGDSWPDTETVRIEVPAADASYNFNFGTTTALSGSYMMVGASGPTSGSPTLRGKAYIFDFTGMQLVSVTPNVAGAAAGSVAFNAELRQASVGAPQDDWISNDNEGKVRTYTFNLPPYLEAQDPSLGAFILTDGLFSFRVRDLETTIDPTSVKVYVQVLPGGSEDTAYDGTTFVAPYDGGGSSFAPYGSDGYALTVDRTSDYTADVWYQVRVEAQDSNGNLLPSPSGDRWLFPVIASPQTGIFSISDFNYGAETDYGDGFGSYADMSSDGYLVVGAPHHAYDNEKGAAYLLHWDGSLWHHERQIVGTGLAVDDHFGFCVRTSGDWVLVTAPYNGSYYNGKAFVYKISDPTFEQVITPVGLNERDYFGWDADISGDWLVIGGYGYPNNAGDGAAWFFHNDGGPSPWVEKQKVQAPVPAGNEFGIAVAMDGSVAVVGEHYAGTNRGKLHVFELSGGTWTWQKAMERTSYHNDSWYSFGSRGDYGPTLAVSGDTIVAGAMGEENTNQLTGAVYVFTKSGTWPDTETLRIPVPAEDDLTWMSFGISVALDEGVLAVGGNGPQVEARPYYSGKVWLYDLSGSLRDTIYLGVDGSRWGSTCAYSKTLEQLAVGASTEDWYNIDNNVGTVRTYAYGGTPAVPPYLEAQDPAPDETGVSSNKTVTFRIRDDETYVDASSIRVYVKKLPDGDEETAYDGEDFDAPYNGPGSSIVSYGGDGYALSLDRTAEYDSLGLYQVRVEATDSEGTPLPSPAGDRWSFTIEEYVPPYLEAQDPAPDATGVDPNTLVSCRIRDDVGVIGSSIRAYVTKMPSGTEETAYDGIGFLPPYDGLNSSLDAYGLDGFTLTIDKTYAYEAGNTYQIRIEAEDTDGHIIPSPEDRWTFLVSGTARRIWLTTEKYFTEWPDWYGIIQSVDPDTMELASEYVWPQYQGATNAIFGVGSAPLLAAASSKALHYESGSWIEKSIGTSAVDTWGLSADNLYAVGQGFWHYDGASWSELSHPSTAPNGLTAVFGFSDDDIWTGGYVDGGNTVWHWDGDSWTAHAATGSIYAAARVICIWGTSSSDIWVTFYYSQLPDPPWTETYTISHWNGVSWDRDWSVTGYDFTTVHGSAPDDVWLLGFRPTGLYLPAYGVAMHVTEFRDLAATPVDLPIGTPPTGYIAYGANCLHYAGGKYYAIGIRWSGANSGHCIWVYQNNAWYITEYAGTMGGEVSASIWVAVETNPYLEAQVPASHATNVAVDTLVSCRIRDDSAVIGSSVKAYVRTLPDGIEQLAYSYGTGFVTPYDGGGSAISPYESDGYSLVLDRTSDYDSASIYQIRIEATNEHGYPIPYPDDRWQFTTEGLTVHNIWIVGGDTVIPRPDPDEQWYPRLWGTDDAFWTMDQPYTGPASTLYRTFTTIWGIHNASRPTVFGGDLFAIDNSTDGYLYHDNGLSWDRKRLASTHANPKANDLWGLSADSLWCAQGCDWAIDDPDPGNLQHYDGESWSVVGGAPSGHPVLAIWGFAEDDIWISFKDSGDLTDKIYHWNGSVWTGTGAPFFALPTYYLHGTSSSDLWALGDQVVAHWTGSTWEGVGDDWWSLFFDIDFHASGCWAFAADDIWFVGNVGDDGYAIHVTGWKDPAPTYQLLPEGTAGDYSARGCFGVDGALYVAGVGPCNHCVWYHGSPWTIHEYEAGYTALGEYGFEDIWVSSGMVPTPPYLEAQDPAPDETDVAADKTVTFRIRDAETYVDPASIRIYVQKSGDSEQQIYDGVTFAAPYDAGSHVDGYALDGYAATLIRTGDYDSYALYQIRVEAQDSEGTPLPSPGGDRWSFRITDYTAPYLEAQDPAPGAINVSEDKIVTFRIRDDETSVDPATVRVYVQELLPLGSEEPAYDGVGFVAPYDGPGSTFSPYASDGYALTVNRTTDYDLFGTYQFRVEASDIYGNPLTAPGDRWSFRIVDTEGPYLEAQDPLPDATDVAVDTLVSCRVLDDDSGIVATSVKAYVRKLPLGPEEPAYDGYNFIAPYDGYGSSFSPYPDGYVIVIDRTSDYDEGGLYQIRMEAEDAYGNTLPNPGDRWSFSIIDSTPPYLEAQDPAPNDVDVPENKIVTFRIRDDETSVDPETVRVFVQKLPDGSWEDAYGVGGFVAPYDGPGSSFSPYASDGYVLAIDRTSDYDSFGTYLFRVEAYDVRGNPLAFPYDRWSFRIVDYVPPYLEAQDPAPGATDVAKDTLVSCRVRDDGSGVVGTTVKAYVRKLPLGVEETAYDGNAFVAPYDGPASSFSFYGPDGYAITLDRTADYDDGAAYQVRMEAEDAYGNTIPYPDDRWSFSVIDLIPPYLEAQDPAPDAVDVPENKIVTFRIRDDETYIDQASVRVYVRQRPDGFWETAYSDGVFVAPYDGPGSSFSPYASDGYALAVDRTSDYESYVLYEFRVEAQDSDGNPLPSPEGDRWSFRIVDYVPPYLEAQDPAPGATDVVSETLVSCRVRDEDTTVIGTTVRAYVKRLPAGIEETAYDGSAFVSPYDGPESSFLPFVTDGYTVILDRTTDYSNGGDYQIRMEAEDAHGNPLPSPSGDRWSFSIALSSIWLENKHPENTGGTDLAADVGFDILGDRTLKLGTLQVFLNGSQILQGPDTFLPPFDGPGSSITSIAPSGTGYRVVFDDTGLLTPDGYYLVSVYCESEGDASLAPGNFSFIAENIIESVEMGPYEITLDVTFSTYLSSLAGALSTANYVFDGGAYARKAELLEIAGDSVRKVRLWVERLYDRATFMLGLGPRLLDSHNCPVVREFAIVPFQSDANISNYNGRIRTWRESEFVQADSQRIYLAGSRGIDVFRKQTKVNPVRWAQVFDGYGISAMFVANYGGDYVFSDAVPPYLKDQVPSPGGTAYTTDPIDFSVADLVTAVEIPSVRVYVNNILAFRGDSDGWHNGFSGGIDIGFQELVFEVLAPAGAILPDTVVSVRVIATDLLGNVLDTTYTFTAVSP